MTQISSRSTASTKWVFPVLWVGFLVLFIVTSAQDGTLEKDPMFLLAPILMIVVGLLMFRFYLWDLADLVEDHGTYLLVRRRGQEARVPLENIMNVSYSAVSNPKRVTLRLVQPSSFGKEVVFLPKLSFTLNPFSKAEVVENLMERAYAARVKRGV